MSILSLTERKIFFFSLLEGGGVWRQGFTPVLLHFAHFVSGKPAKDVLKEGLKDLNTVCEHILRTFEVMMFLTVCLIRHLQIILNCMKSVWWMWGEHFGWQAAREEVGVIFWQAGSRMIWKSPLAGIYLGNGVCKYFGRQVTGKGMGKESFGWKLAGWGRGETWLAVSWTRGWSKKLCKQVDGQWGRESLDLQVAGQGGRQTLAGK